MVCGASRESIGVVKLGIIKDASHNTAKKGAGVVSLWGPANGVSRKMISSGSRVRVRRWCQSNRIRGRKACQEFQLSYRYKSVVCGLVCFRSMTFVNEVTETGSGKELLVYETNGGMRRREGDDKARQKGKEIQWKEELTRS